MKLIAFSLLLLCICLPGFAQRNGAPQDCSSTFYFGGAAVPACAFYDGVPGASTLIARWFRNTGIFWTYGGIAFNGKLSTDTAVDNDAIASLVNTSATGYGVRVVAGGSDQSHYLLALSDYSNTTRFAVYGDNTIYIAGKLYADLGGPGAGTFTYCTDCTVGATCAGGGSGAWAFRNSTVWKCPF